MTKEQIVRKLTSRKFWVALVAFIAALLTAFKVPEASAAQVTSIIMAFGSLVAYIFAEGWTDSASLKADQTIQTTNIYKGPEENVAVAPGEEDHDKD